MERFKKINWNPALEDIIDDVFINDERMERESAMYRIMRGDFTDPFEDIEQDYADVNMELIQKFLAEDPFTDTEEEEQKETNSGKRNRKKTNTEHNCYKQTQKDKLYVPGIRKLSFNFPKTSCLTMNQHCMYLDVLLKLGREQKSLSKEEQRMQQSYIELKEKILEEQKEFLDFAKSKWNDSFDWKIRYDKFITFKWSRKMKKFQKLPRYYIESKNISLSVQKINSTFIKSIEIKFISCLHQLGSFSKIMWPKLDRPSMLSLNSTILNKNHCVTPNNVTQHFRLPVSDDTYCEKLAMETNADFVISSSGLKCLLNNDSCYLNSWTIPVVIKSHNGKNVVYIDKRIPPIIATIPQKNTWVYKYILREIFTDPNNAIFKKTEQQQKIEKHTKEKKSEKATVHSDLNDVDIECSAEFNDYLKIYEEDLYVSESESSNNVANDNKTNDTKINVMYKLFTIGPTECLNYELGKHDVKKYQMLVRTKTDGIEVSPDNKSHTYIMLTPKMEHQLEFGAEAATFAEISHQWTSLIFRPEASLARVRLAADTSEIIQIEKHTAASLSNEMRRLYNVKIEDSLSILHNIIKELSSLTPGQYIMRHIPQRGPFAYVYKQNEGPGKNVFDLRIVCQSGIFQTVPKTPWPFIDTMLTTPALRHFKKMPAMFNPCPKRFSKKSQEKQNQIDSAPRRSLRLKEMNKK
ncbi:uncharacterized protein [Anoplolepis gracilipes]|uniref:uncharacterized protein n=1 Tax=Anoplolepis gracilipes TaxID=354296 RepID=UPI003BA0D9EA